MINSAKVSGSRTGFSMNDGQTHVAGIRGGTTVPPLVCPSTYGYDVPPAGRFAYDGLGNLRTASRQHLAGIPPRTSSQNAPVTGLDYFGARYYSGAQGRFTSPDPGAYKLEDPQTFNRYAYVNNNPLKYVDPTGKEAEYVVDEKKKTITIRASITIYGPQATAAYATKLKNAMETAWKGSYKDPKTGTVYKVSTVADVSVYSPTLGVGLTAHNAFYVGNDVSRSNFQNAHTDPRFPSRYPGDPGVYNGALNPTKGVEAHETGHVLGEPDDYWEDPIRGATGPQPGHNGHLMAGGNGPAAQDEINRIGSYTLGQMRTTHKSEGTIIRLPEPPRPR